MFQPLILSVLSGFIAQTIKFFLNKMDHKFQLRDVVVYSGMPSGHSAMVISLAASIGLIEGIKSAAFAVAVIFAIIVIRDAIGLRRYLGQHGKVLNILVKDLKDDSVLDEKYPHLLENIGHTPAQIMVGAIIGLVVSLIGYLLL